MVHIKLILSDLQEICVPLASEGLVFEIHDQGHMCNLGWAMNNINRPPSHFMYLFTQSYSAELSIKFHLILFLCFLNFHQVFISFSCSYSFTQLIDSFQFQFSVCFNSLSSFFLHLITTLIVASLRGAAKSPSRGDCFSKPCQDREVKILFVFQ